jgi:hypothetical protein
VRGFGGPKPAGGRLCAAAIAGHDIGAFAARSRSRANLPLWAGAGGGRGKLTGAERRQQLQCSALLGSGGARPAWLPARLVPLAAAPAPAIHCAQVAAVAAQAARHCWPPWPRATAGRLRSPLLLPPPPPLSAAAAAELHSAGTAAGSLRTSHGWPHRAGLSGGRNTVWHRPADASLWMRPGPPARAQDASCASASCATLQPAALRFALLAAVVATLEARAARRPPAAQAAAAQARGLPPSALHHSLAPLEPWGPRLWLHHLHALRSQGATLERDCLLGLLSRLDLLQLEHLRRREGGAAGRGGAGAARSAGAPGAAGAGGAMRGPARPRRQPQPGPSGGAALGAGDAEARRVPCRCWRQRRRGAMCAAAHNRRLRCGSRLRACRRRALWHCLFSEQLLSKPPLLLSVPAATARLCRCAAAAIWARCCCCDARRGRSPDVAAATAPSDRRAAAGAAALTFLTIFCSSIRKALMILRGRAGRGLLSSRPPGARRRSPPPNAPRTSP